MFNGNEVYTSKLALNIYILLAFAFLLFIYFAYQIVQISLRPLEKSYSFLYLIHKYLLEAYCAMHLFWKFEVYQ